MTMIQGKDSTGQNRTVLLDTEGRISGEWATSDKQDTLLTELKLKANLTETQPVSVASIALPSGASTSAKQLPDNHNVTVSNMIPAVETGLATSTNQTDGSQKTQITDADDNIAKIVQNSNTENNELLVNLQGHQCPHNTTTEQLISGASFTGSAWQDTIDYGVLSVNIATDVDSATDGLDIQWSNTGIADYTTGTVAIAAITGVVTGSGTTFTSSMIGRKFSVDGGLTLYRIKTFTSATEISIVDLEDSSYTGGLVSAGTSYIISPIDDFDRFTILKNNSKTFTFGPAERYYRVKYTNGSGGTTTSFHLTSLLRKVYVKPSSHRITDSIVGEDDAELIKAVLTGEDPDGTFKNVGVQISGALKTSIEDGQTSRRAEVEPLGALKVETPIRLVGTTFSNGTKDINFWTETVTGTGSVTQAGEITLSTGTTANSTAKYETVRKARKITGTTNQFRAVARNVQAPAANCIRRIGAYYSNEGFFLQFNGTTFQVGSRKSGSDTLVSNGSFNGNGGATISLEATAFTRIVIDYTALSAKFFVDGVLIHTIMATTASLTTTLNLPVTMEIINENGNTTNNSYEILFATILRLGNLVTNPIYKYINTDTTTVCKYNAGTLQRIIINDNVGGIDIYDGTSTGGTLISELDTSQGSEPAYTVEYNVPFSDGLTIVTSGGVEVTVIYE